MIRIRLKGRLGNQMFIYAFARALQEKYHQKALIYDRKKETDAMWHSHLDRFVLNKSISFTSNKSDIMKMSFIAKWLFFKDRIYCRHKSSRQVHDYQLKHWNENLSHGLLLLMDGYKKIPDEIPSDVFCDGYFQSPKYIDHIRPLLLKEFLPKAELQDYEKDMLAKIQNLNSVCITIRLGDYIGNSTHQVCTKEFYLGAMKRIHELQPDCVFYVFSDEVDRAREIFDFPYPVVYDSGQSQDATSLYIMSQCKHFIISNSSFSWWAQYLGTASNKIVIAPDHWYARDVVCDIMQDSWIKLKC